MNQYISVKVCGNPESNSGFNSIAIFNNPTFPIEDKFYVGFNDCSYFITIRTTATAIIFKLVKNNVRSYGAYRDGSLVIAFSMPNGYKFDRGISPYEVLLLLKDAFIGKYMTCKNPDTQTYEFNAGIIMPDILEEVARSFPIVPTYGIHRPMSTDPSTPIAYLILPDDNKIKLLTCEFCRYAEFEKYSEVIISSTATQPSGVNLTGTIQIPRSIAYTVFVNNVKQQQTVGLDTPILLKGTGKPEYYTNKSVQFTPRELLQGTKEFPFVSIDKDYETITATTESLSIPKTFTVTLSFSLPEAEAFFRSYPNMLNITLKGRPKTLTDNLSFTLVGEELAIIKELRFTIKDNSYYKTTGLTCTRDSIMQDAYILTAAVEKVQKPDSWSKFPPRHDPDPRPNPVPVRSVLVTDVKLHIELVEEDRSRRSTTIMVLFKDANDELLSKSLVIFKPYVDRFHNQNLSEGHYFIPQEWSGNKSINNGLCYLQFTYNGVVYRSQRTLNLRENAIELEAKDFSKTKESYFAVYKKHIICCAIFILGIVLGAFLQNAMGEWFSKDEQQSEQSSVTKDTSNRGDQIRATASPSNSDSEKTQNVAVNDTIDIEKLANEIMTELHKNNKGLDFATVERLWDDCKPVKKEMEEDYPGAYDRCNDYHRLVVAIIKKDADFIRHNKPTELRGTLHVFNTHYQPAQNAINSTNRAKFMQAKDIKSFRQLEVMFPNSSNVGVKNAPSER